MIARGNREGRGATTPMIREWLARKNKKKKPPGPPAVADALAALDRLAAAHPDLAHAADILARAIVASFDAPPGDQATARRIRAIAAQLDHPAAPLLAIATLANAEALKSFHLTGADDALDWEARGMGFPVDLLTSVLRIAVLPDLEAEHEKTATIETPAARDIEGPCPACGRFATLAESRGLEGRRFLRCGACAADWPIPRGACPGCGTTDPHLLIYRSDADAPESRIRLWCCDACGLTLPILSTLARLGPLALLVADLEALPLRLAVEAHSNRDPTP
jgi:hypothetical protein